MEMAGKRIRTDTTSLIVERLRLHLYRFIRGLLLDSLSSCAGYVIYVGRLDCQAWL